MYVIHYNFDFSKGYFRFLKKGGTNNIVWGTSFFFVSQQDMYPTLLKVGDSCED